MPPPPIPSPLSHPTFKISHPGIPDVPAQIAWTEGQAERKRARLVVEHGEGFVIEANPLPEEKPAAAAVAAVARSDRPYAEPGAERTEAQPFIVGDVIRDKHSGTEAAVLQVLKDKPGVRVLVPGQKIHPFVPAANYGDFTLLDPAQPAPAAEEPGSSSSAESGAEDQPADGTKAAGDGTNPPADGTKAAGTETAAAEPQKKKLTPKRPPVKNPAAKPAAKIAAPRKITKRTTPPRRHT